MVTGMDPLPHEPRSLCEFVEADLRRAARLIIKVQDEIDPQFPFSTPEGGYHLSVTLPAGDDERRAVFRPVQSGALRECGLQTKVRRVSLRSRSS